MDERKRSHPAVEQIALDWNRGAIQERVNPLGQTMESVFSQAAPALVRPELSPAAAFAGGRSWSGRKARAVRAGFSCLASPFALGCTAILLLALAARLLGLGVKPLWLDEVFTAIRSSRAVPALILDSLQNRHLPGFFLIEHGVLSLGFGGGPALLRLVPAIAGAVTAPLAFAIAWKLGGRAAAWLAGLLLALAPLQVAFGQEARSYTLTMALIMLALLGLIGLAIDPAAGARRFRDPEAPRGAWCAYGFGTLGAALVLGDALPWLIVASVAMAGGILPWASGRRGLFRNWLSVHAVILLFALPGYVRMLAAVHNQVLQSFLWIPPLSVQTLWMDAASLYGLRDTTMVTLRLLPTPLGGLAMAAFILAGLGAWRLRHQPGPLIVLTIAFLGLPVALGVMSLVHPVLLPRYLLWSAGPFFVLAGLGIESIPRRLSVPAVAAACVVLVLNLLPYYGAETKPRWDVAQALLAERFAPGDMLLVSDGAATVMLDFYRQGAKPRQPAWPASTRPQAAAPALADGHRVFAVYGPAGQGRQPDRSRFFAAATGLGRSGAVLRAGSAIFIQEIYPKAHPDDGPNIAGPAEAPRG